jgi:hypothetical protein
VLSGTISRMTVKRMANQVSGSVLANDYIYDNNMCDLREKCQSCP